MADSRSRAHQSPTFDKRRCWASSYQFGTAYRNQAMELISICRVFSYIRAGEQIFSQDTELSDVLRACDEALASAAEARKETSWLSDLRFKKAITKLNDYEKKFHRCDQSSQESNANCVRNRMENAKKKDIEEKLESEKHRWQFFKRQGMRAEDATSRVVRFHLLTSISDSQPTLVQQLLTNGPTLEEILWNFSRFSPSSKWRVCLAENPHFYPYEHLPITSPNSFQGTEPMRDYDDAGDINVLTNKPGRVFLEFGEKSRAFDNVWQHDGIFIFKSICGRLECERIFGALIQDKSCWYNVGPRPSQDQVGSTVGLLNPPGTSGITLTTDNPAWVRIDSENWRDVISYILDSHDIKIRICTEPVHG